MWKASTTEYKNTPQAQTQWFNLCEKQSIQFYLAWHLFYKPIAGENQQRKQLENARSIQIVSNNAEQGHCLSGLDWQVTADVWSPRKDEDSEGAEDREPRMR